jgi:ATP-dependent DNA helicase PIF1
MELSTEQLQAIALFEQGANVFLTGPGGTGKTAIIKHMYLYALRRSIPIQVCALTGCAAMLLECKAKTLHSWAGIGLGNGTVDELLTKIRKNRNKVAMWKEIRILVVDEVSMMSLKLFDLISALGKALRRNSRPFGGIQVIFSGDFYQLPPVGNIDDPPTAQFCFESLEWRETFPLEHHVSLRKIFRQADPVYQSILNQLREGRLKWSAHKTLEELVGKPLPDDTSIRPTKLLPTRNKVDNINITEMANLPGDPYVYHMQARTDLEIQTTADRLRRQAMTPEQIQAELLYLQNNVPCETTLNLKVGSQVMYLVNAEPLCNGTRGIVTAISTLGYPVVQFTNNVQQTVMPYIWKSETVPGVGLSQLPLILAWALTIHKAQGATLDVAEVDAGSGIFECGQTYVALSRVKSMDGLYLQSFDAQKVRVNLKVRRFYTQLQEEQAQLAVAEDTERTEDTQRTEDTERTENVEVDKGAKQKARAEAEEA